MWVFNAKQSCKFESFRRRNVSVQFSFIPNLFFSKMFFCPGSFALKIRVFFGRFLVTTWMYFPENSQNNLAKQKTLQVFRFGGNFVIIKLTDMMYYVTLKLFKIVLLKNNWLEPSLFYTKGSQASFGWHFIVRGNNTKFGWVAILHLGTAETYTIAE